MLDHAVERAPAPGRIVVERGPGPQRGALRRHDRRDDLLVAREHGIVAAIAHRLLANHQAPDPQRGRPGRQRGTGIGQVAEQQARVDQVRGQRQLGRDVGDREVRVGNALTGLGDHRRRRVDSGREAVRDRLAQERGREAGTATHVDDVAIAAVGKVAQQRARRRFERVGDQPESFACEVRIAEGVRHTSSVARLVAAASRLFSSTTPSLDPSSTSDAFGVRHQTDDVAFRVADARDVVEAAVGIVDVADDDPLLGP